MKNESRVILVTGGTRGIGAAIAADLHGRGHRVYVTQRAQLESGRQDGLQVLCLDVTSAASVEACVQELLRREGHIDVLVNNAGYDLFGAVIETQWHEFMDQLDTNFLGAARMVQAVLPRMLERRSGRIINISSIGGSVDPGSQRSRQPVRPAASRTGPTHAPRRPCQPHSAGACGRRRRAGGACPSAGAALPRRRTRPLDPATESLAAGRVVRAIHAARVPLTSQVHSYERRAARLGSTVRELP